MKEVVKIINKSNNPLPAYQTPGSAGMDIQADIRDANLISIRPGATAIVSTGIYLAIPEGYECQVRSRSGLAAKQGIVVLNSPGTIDSDYRGELKVILINHGVMSANIHHGDRIAQLVFNKIEQPAFTLVEELDSTERGEGGFGSTGK